MGIYLNSFKRLGKEIVDRAKEIDDDALCLIHTDANHRGAFVVYPIAAASTSEEVREKIKDCRTGGAYVVEGKALRTMLSAVGLDMFNVMTCLTNEELTEILAEDGDNGID
jgi:hypothetical protein